MDARLRKFLDTPKLVFLVLFLWVLFSLKLTDPDYYWHLKTGEYLFIHGAIPATDVFSYTRGENPWVLHEWLFELVLYLVHEWTGAPGVTVLTAFLGILSVYVAYAAAKRLVPGVIVPCTLAIAFFIPVMPGLSPRPQLVTYLLFACYLYTIIDFKYFKSTRHLWTLPLLMVLWVNTHGGYIIGAILLTLFTVSEWVLYRHLGDGEPARKKQLIMLTTILALTILATAVNPYLFSHWLYPLYVINLDFSISVISEWASPNFHLTVYKLYLLLVFAFFVVNIYRLEKPDLTELTIPLLVLTMSFISVRHLPLAGLTMIPFTARAIADSDIQRFYGRWIGGKGELGNAEYVMNWLVLAGLGAAAAVYYPIHNANSMARLDLALPVKATEFVRKHGITGRMFNTYHFGGYLIYHLFPEQRVFIDGRADMYGDAFVKEYADMETAQPGWEELFEKHRIDYLIIKRAAPIRQALLARGDYKLVYDDENNSVLLKNEPQYAQLIAHHGQCCGDRRAAP